MMPFIKHQIFGKLILTKTFWLLTFSDLFTWGFYLIISTLSGIYLEHKLGEDVIKIVGIGGAIYYVIRGVLQLPISKVLDRIKNDKDEIFVLTIGCILMGLPFLFYPTLTSANQYYVLQVIFSLGVAMNLNPWRKLFATNLQAGKEAREYAVYDMVNSMFIAFSIFFVGQIANINQFYFDVMMVSLGLLVMTGGLWAALISTDTTRKSSNNLVDKKT
jgi:MFS-type transporter involved in bile tolerance (Atg22 family)